MIVVDSSVALQWLLPEPGTAVAEALLSHPDDLVAPDILIIEVANVLAKKVRARDMDLAQVAEGLQLVREAVTLADLSSLATSALKLAIELSNPVYDCCFLACAIDGDAAIATRDQPFIDRMVRSGYGERAQRAGPAA